MAVVEFKNVSIIFGDNATAALPLADAGETREEILEETGSVLGASNCSIAIEEGEICVLMGLSGSGKSTLLRAVNGLNKVTRGEVLVADGDTTIDVASCSAKVLRHLRMGRVAMVFQQFGLLPWRTVEENVGLGLELRGVSKEERKATVGEKLKLVSLEPWKNKYGHELSGGMQQRVGLARAFATDAEILLMDEPFSALDPLIRNHLQDELLDLQRTLKKTIIFVSHDLDEAIKIGSHIAIMDGGRIVQYGKPEEIVLHPANQYVADFVANMNPLHVLRCASLMTPVARIEQESGELRLDWSGHSRVVVDDRNRPVKVTVDGADGRLVAYDPGLDLDELGHEEVVTAGPDLRMHTAIEIRSRTGTPVVIVEDERMIGVVGDDEIYQGMLRQSGLAAKVAADAAAADDEPAVGG
ncbi:MAG: choline ABC transporter ATP-binding protein [Alphaproteobacteria bacterium]|nr:choline ABC transporter ATP-binding protein [Alphaproteobacteria bacterium]